MARKKEPQKDPLYKTETVVLPNTVPTPLTGLKHLATIKDGWTARMQREGYIILTHATEQPRMVELASVQDGDVLPRDTDEAFAYPPAVGGA